MSSQHLSDEAVAAFADGVLVGHARERATRHVEACAECRQAVKVQREAAWALRAAAAPPLPSALRDRLRTLPMTTPVTTLPTAVAPDGSTVLSTFAPVAAFVPPQPDEQRSGRRLRPFVTGAAVVALAGALAAGSVARHEEPAQTGSGDTVQRGTVLPGTNGPVGVDRVNVFRGNRP